MNKVVTIGREFGSGGREVGIQLAEKLNIPFYDKELISLAAENGGLSSDFISSHEESFTPYFRPVISGRALFSLYEQQPITDKIFLAQLNIIKKLSLSGPCVIVGRCADYVLGDSAVNTFIYADIKDRVSRKLTMDIDIQEKDMKKHILSIDKKRAKYYQHYTGQSWGPTTKHHLCINSSGVGIDGTVQTIISYLKYLDSPQRADYKGGKNV